jgi:hypothetical protein
MNLLWIFKRWGEEIKNFNTFRTNFLCSTCLRLLDDWMVFNNSRAVSMSTKINGVSVEMLRLTGQNPGNSWGERTCEFLFVPFANGRERRNLFEPGAAEQSLFR